MDFVSVANIPRPSLQAESASPIYVVRIHHQSSGFRGVEVSHNSHGSAPYYLHEVVWWIL